MRLKEIAKFAAIAQNNIQIIKYTIYQIPYILPLAIPISCAIASFLLFQKFSKSNEIIAIRSCGISLKKIIFPIIFISFSLSLINFFIISDLSVFCRMKSKQIKSFKTSLNPIFLLEKQNLLKTKKSYINFEKGPKKNKANDVFIILPNKSNNRLNLAIFEELYLKKDILIGKNVSIVSHFKNENNFDTLIIENQKTMQTKAKNISKYMKPKSFSLNTLKLPTKMVLVRNKIDSFHKNNKNKYVFSMVEIVRRIMLSFSSFTLSFIGICFGIETKSKKNKNLFLPIFLALFILISFTIGKSFKYHLIMSILIYILPQPISLIFALNNLKKISRGIL